MKTILITVLLTTFSFLNSHAQDVQIDGRLQPLLNNFFDLCKKYNIQYHDKLFKLETIDVVQNLALSENNTTLGMLRRNTIGEVVAIDINWVAQLDDQILKVIAFHEFAHYFLEYSTHICQDCGQIMSVVNTSYYDIIDDWDNQVSILFEESPAYQKQLGSSITSRPVNGPQP